MKILSELINDLEIIKIDGDTSKNISSVHFDSRHQEKQSAFVAIKGSSQNGHNFIDEAIRNGATTIVYQEMDQKKLTDITYIRVKDSRIALASLIQNFYDNPSKKLRLVGVTGTNGKTTTVTVLFQLFKILGYPSALFSTIENKINDQTYVSSGTTPDPVTLTSFLNQAVNHGCQYAFMECSSHAIDQKRIAFINFAGAILTNLTHDHLDYHKTMKAYGESKKAFFDALSEDAVAVTNQDEDINDYILSETKAKKYFFSLKNIDMSQSMEGLRFRYDGEIFTTKLIGTFNAYNIVGAYILAKLFGISKHDLIQAIPLVRPPAGRMEIYKSKTNVYGIIDYAHTPDALEQSLNTVREIAPRDAKIITVVGSSGQSDSLKRPLMGKIAYDLSDYIVFSSDNPRNEDPEQILKDMIRDLPSNNDKYVRESNRKKAVDLAYERAAPGDVIFLAGKGHENYQIIGEQKIPYSDREEWKIRAQ